MPSRITALSRRRARVTSSADAMAPAANTTCAGVSHHRTCDGKTVLTSTVPPTATTNTTRISPRYRGSEPRWVTAVTSAATSSSRRMNRRYTRSASGPW